MRHLAWMLLAVLFHGAPALADEDPAGLVSRLADRGATAGALYQDLILAQKADLSSPQKAAASRHARRLAAHQASHVRREAMRLLGRLGDTSAVELLRAALKHREPLEREAGATALGRLGEAALAARADLIGLLDDKQIRVQLAALYALSRVAADPQTVALLVSRVAGASSQFRNGVAHALGQLGGEAVIDPLWKLYADKDPTLRQAVIESLGRVKQARVGTLLPAALWDVNLLVRMAAVEALYMRGDLASLSFLIDELKHLEKWRRIEAFRLLRRLTGQTNGYREGAPSNAKAIAAWRGWLAKKVGNNPTRRVDLLLAALRSPSEKVRQAAGKQLVALRDKRAARRLKAAYIASSSAGARVWILRAIVAIGSREAIEICRVALKSADVEQRRVAAMALSRYGKSETLSLLLSAIEDKDETVRVCVIQALGRFKSKTLLPQLVKVARSDTSWRVRRAAIRALIEIDPKQALPLVSSSLRDGREEVRVATARAMASMLDPRFASALATALADKSAKVRHHAARGLALSATAAEVPALEQALTSVPDPGTRSYIVRALARVGAPSGIPGLTQAMSDRHHSVRSTAASLAGALKLSNLVPPLCKLLQDSNDAVRLSAAEALGKIGDPRAVEPLWQLIGRGSDPVRRSALEALGTIPGAAALGRLVTAAKELSADRELISVVKILKTRVAPLGIPGLVAIARRGSSAVRVSAIYALAVLGLDDNATVVLRSSLGSRDSAMRQAALWTIGRLVPEELERDLIAALPREKGKLRAPMLAALAAYRTPAALKALLDAAAAEQAGSSLTVVLNHLARMRDPGAEKVLFAAVGDSRQPGSTRGAVARVLPQLPGWKSVPVLAKLLSAKDADLRRHAAYSLGQIRHPSAIEPLQAALATEKQTQNLQNILLGLSLLRGGANTPRVRGWLTPSAKDFVLYAAWAIGKSGDPQGPQLLRALAVNPKASSHIKGYLSHPLGASGLAGAHEVLMLLLADKSANVREQAIYGCWTMHDTKAAPAIAKALRDEKDYVRAGAAAVLGDLQRGVQTAALIRPLLAESSQYVQALATIGLYRCGDKPDQAPLRWSVNRARVNSGADLAAAVLATHPDPESFAGLVACLQSSSDRIAWPAGLALGRLKDKRAVPTLRGAIYGRAAIVEAFAADALLSLGIDTPRIRRSMKSTLPLLIARLLSYHPQTRAQVAALLRRRTGKSFGYDWRGSLDSWRSSRDRWFAWWDAVHRQLSYEPRSGHFKTPTGSGQQPNKPRQKTK